MERRAHNGFTLIELSIVLVIIGLLISGIVVGKEMISAAQVRAAARQIEQLEMAVNAFRLKYSCLPGDCLNAATFGFTYDIGMELGGNGDGRIFYYYTDADSGVNGRESALALVHLYEAGLVSGIEGTGDGSVLPFKITAINPHCGRKASLFIEYQVGDWVGGNAGHHIVVASGNADCTAVLSASAAYSIDAKLDDGLPRSGKTMATGNNDSIASDPTGLDRATPALSSGGPAGTDSPYCFTDAIPPQYNVLNTAQYQEGGGDGPLCVLGIRTSF